MIHKFTSNDNKGNVNSVEVGSTYTKLGRVAPPVEDTDAANKEYVDSVAGGSGGGVLVVHMDIETTALDKTWKEIAESDLCILNDGSAKLMQYGISVSPGKFKVKFWDFSESSQVIYIADTETGYPVYYDSGEA